MGSARADGERLMGWSVLSDQLSWLPGGKRTCGGSAAVDPPHGSIFRGAGGRTPARNLTPLSPVQRSSDRGAAAHQEAAVCKRQPQRLAGGLSLMRDGDYVTYGRGYMK